MQQLAGIINEDLNPALRRDLEKIYANAPKLEFSSDVKAFIDDAIQSAKEDGSFERLKKYGYYELRDLKAGDYKDSLISAIIYHFDDNIDHKGVDQATKDYIAKVTK